MENSLFVPLREEGLTTLKIRYDWKKDQVFLYAARDWDPELDFSRYNKDFTTDSRLTHQAQFFNDAQVRDLFSNYQLLDYLNTLLDLIKQGRHVGMDCYYFHQYNIRFIGNLHSRLPGVNNRSHATSCGGIRRHGFEDKEIDVIKDGLNLSRAMTYKNIAAELPFGGCKTTVHMDKLDLENMEILGFLAYSLDCLRCHTGPDMGFPTELADKMNEHFSVQFSGGPRGPLGSTGKPTAYGIYLALKEALRFQQGSASLDGKSIAVQGLGSVGWSMCEYLLQENVTLYVTDTDPAMIQKFIAAHPDRPIEAVASDQILKVDTDVFCPSAVGGIISEEVIPQLKFRFIFGGANNQLKATSNQEEIRLARMLAERGILYQESWWHNTGGVLAGAEEYLHGANASRDRLMQTIEKIVPAKTWQNLNKAKELGITPTECIYRTCDEILASGR